MEHENFIDRIFYEVCVNIYRTVRVRCSIWETEQQGRAIKNDQKIIYRKELGTLKHHRSIPLQQSWNIFITKALTWFLNVEMAKELDKHVLNFVVVWNCLTLW